MGLVDYLISSNRLWRFEYNKISKQIIKNSRVIEITNDHIESYLRFFGISYEQAEHIYWKFVKKYSSDLASFQACGMYPVESGDTSYLNREEYDIALVLSVVFSPVRYNIMSRIHDCSKFTGNITAVIGVGSGLELRLLEDNIHDQTKIDAYDIDIGTFLKRTNSANINLIEQVFPKNNSKYRCVFAIELLEHLQAPYSLVDAVAQSLYRGGFFIFTTATNMPQIDHYYNFDDDGEVNRVLSASGFEIIDKAELPHHYFGYKIQAKNTFYVCRKL